MNLQLENKFALVSGSTTVGNCAPPHGTCSLAPFMDFNNGFLPRRLTGGLLVWAVCQLRDPMFHRQRESYWIAHILNVQEATVKQWRAFGPEGVDVLMRGLKAPERPMARAYRQGYDKLESVLPNSILHRLHLPRPDSPFLTRYLIIHLLGSIGESACTRETVSVLADLALPRVKQCNEIGLAYAAVSSLGQWGLSASNSIPKLLRALRDQTRVSGLNFSAGGVSLNYAWALACIGPDSPGVLMEILAAERSPFSDGLSSWVRNSKSHDARLRAIAIDPTVPVELRNKTRCFLDGHRGLY